jgi:hypothetical protein
MLFFQLCFWIGVILCLLSFIMILITTKDTNLNKSYFWTFFFLISNAIVQISNLIIKIW